MANNLHSLIPDDEWKAIQEEGGEADVEIYILRKDKTAILVEREIPIEPAYVQVLLAALLDLPKVGITSIKVYVDGSKWP